MKELEAIKSIFNAKDMAEMKKAMRETVVDQFRRDMESLDVYLFDLSHVDNVINETFMEILQELKTELKEKLREKMFNGLEQRLESLLK